MRPIPRKIPSIISGWGDSYFSQNLTIKGFYWDWYYQVLYTQTPTAQFNVWLNVPQSTAQQMASQPNFNPDAFYKGFCTQNLPCLLTEDCVPLTCEDGTFLLAS